MSAKRAPVVVIEFGALAPSLSDQLLRLGIVFAELLATDISHWQRMADAITLLVIQGVITESSAHVARSRLARKFIVKECNRVIRRREREARIVARRLSSRLIDAP